MYKEIKKIIETFNTIIIHRHSKPDGDALGSQIGLSELIKTNYPNKQVYVVGDMMDRYSFIGTMDNVNDDAYTDALAVVLDCSDSTLVNDGRYKKAKKILKIDHHIFKEKFGDIDVVDDSYESCCGLLVSIGRNLKWKFNQKAATALFTGMVTDSGRFRYGSTNSQTFDNASYLMNYDIDIMSIYNELYVDDLDIVKLRAKYTLKFTQVDHFAYIKNTKEDVLESNVDFFTISRGMVGVMAGIRGIDVWANFTETDNGIVCELRTNKYNVNKIATAFGGGGHLQASGATVDSWEVVDKMIDELIKLSGGNNG